jgi:hypothetical protein
MSAINGRPTDSMPRPVRDGILNCHDSQDLKVQNVKKDATQDGIFKNGALSQSIEEDF